MEASSFKLSFEANSLMDNSSLIDNASLIIEAVSIWLD